jgi:uncharacterized membrane protein
MWRAVSTTGQIILGNLLLFTGTAHLTFARAEFQAQVPSWLPIDENVMVVASGVVELCLAVALLATSRQPARHRGRRHGGLRRRDPARQHRPVH